MRFASFELEAVLAKWEGATDIHERACAHNLQFEEHASDTRRDGLQARLAGIASTPEELRIGLIDHYFETVRDAAGIPETFRAENGLAALDEPSPEVVLVRLEDIRAPLEKMLATVADLQENLERKDRASSAFVEKFLRIWNFDPEVLLKRNPICFAARRAHLEPELSAPDWVDRLRDRLGLAHYDVRMRGPIDVALMEYEVKDVTGAMRHIPKPPHLFAIPTALDSEPYSAFFPTPREMSCGCPMALAPISSEEDLIAEFLHLRFTYRRQHLKKIATITTSPSRYELSERRNNHLLALQFATGRVDDFGREI